MEHRSGVPTSMTRSPANGNGSSAITCSARLFHGRSFDLRASRRRAQSSCWCIQWWAMKWYFHDSSLPISLAVC